MRLNRLNASSIFHHLLRLRKDLVFRQWKAPPEHARGRNTFYLLPLLDQNQRFRLHETSSLDSVEVDTGCEVGSVELDFVVASVDVGVDELSFL